MRLLLVEDNELLGSAVHKGLARFGYAVDWIRSGKDVLAAFLGAATGLGIGTAFLFGHTIGW